MSRHMKKTRISQQQKDELAKALIAAKAECGKTNQQIAAESNLSSMTIGNLLQANGSAESYELALEACYSDVEVIRDQRYKVLSLWTDRVDDLTARIEAGETLDVIGEAYGVTRERIRQVLHELGLYEQAKTARHARSRLTSDQQKMMLKALAQRPCDLIELAELVGAPISRVRRAVNEGELHYLLKGTGRDNFTPPTFSDEQIIGWLRELGERHGHANAVLWEAEIRPKGGPTDQLVPLRLGGSWHIACEKAGILYVPGSTVAQHRKYKRRWTSAETEQIVYRFAVRMWQSGIRPTIESYEAWAKGQKKVPSRSTVLHHGVNVIDVFARARQDSLGGILNG
jgi:predicted transcriptional regulator